MKEMKTTLLKETCAKIIIESIENLLVSDGVLLKNNTHEVSISGQLANYMKEYLSHEPIKVLDLKVDIEYNRMLNISDEQERDYISKAIYVTTYDHNPAKNYLHDNIKKYIRPDIIIHKRETNDLNILWIELKINVPEWDCGFDIQKTWYALTQLNYKMGISILINYESGTVTFNWVDKEKVERVVYIIDNNLLKEKERKMFNYEHFCY